MDRNADGQPWLEGEWTEYGETDPALVDRDLSGERSGAGALERSGLGSDRERDGFGDERSGFEDDDRERRDAAPSGCDHAVAKPIPIGSSPPSGSEFGRLEPISDFARESEFGQLKLESGFARESAFGRHRLEPRSCSTLSSPSNNQTSVLGRSFGLSSRHAMISDVLGSSLEAFASPVTASKTPSLLSPSPSDDGLGRMKLRLQIGTSGGQRLRRHLQSRASSFSRSNSVACTSTRSLSGDEDEDVEEIDNDATLSPARRFLGSFSSWPASTTVERNLKVGDYVLGHKVGHGGFSVVREAHSVDPETNTKSSRVLACKIVRNRELAQTHFDQEILIWQMAKHPNILSLVDVISTSDAIYAFAPKMEGGNMYQFVRNHSPVGIPQVCRFVSQIASCVYYLHTILRVVHRDIKLENFLLNSDRTDLVLCDFGMAQFLTEENCKDVEDMTNYTTGGSLPYLSPEQLRSPGSAVIHPCVDMWAIGVIVHSLLCGRLPFADTFEPRLQAQIIRGEWHRQHLLEMVDKDKGCARLAELVEHLLQTNVADRCTAEQLFDVIREYKT